MAKTNSITVLFWYFLKKLYIRFFFFLIAATLLFASGDLFARMAALSSGFLFIMFAFFMLPLMILSALPIASSCAVATVVSGLFIEDEVLLLRFLPKARQALVAAIFAFACSMVLCAFPFVFSWVPQSYWKGKQFLATAAHRHLDCLQVKKWHTIVSGFTVRFEEKETDIKGFLQLKQIIIRYAEKNKTTANLIFAEHGTLLHGVLYLYHGTVYSGIGVQMRHGSFTEMRLDMGQISGIYQFYKPEKGVKFLLASQLLDQSQTDIISFLELLKRWSQLFWNAVFPIVVFCFLFSSALGHSLFVRSMSFILLLFLLFYFSNNMAAHFAAFPLISLFLLYGIPFLLCILFIVRYKKQW